MKNLVLCLFITAISLNLLARESGPSTGGGAYVITCPENPLEPALNVLLDLYEGSHVLSFNMKKASGSIEQDYVDSVRQTYTLQGLPNFKHPTDDELIRQLKDFFRSVKIIENPNELPIANDLGETPKIPSQCQIKQLGYFSDEDQVIYILKPLWDKLDSLSKAAFAQHELHYRFKRFTGEDRTSFLTRRVVAHLFARDGVVPIDDGLIIESRTYYSSTDPLSVLTMTPKYIIGPAVRLQFSQINGYGLVSKTWADIQAPIWDLKEEFTDKIPYHLCRVKTPNTDLDITVPLNGTLYPSNYKVRYEYKTNQQIKISIIKPDGNTLTEIKVDGRKNCSGT